MINHLALIAAKNSSVSIVTVQRAIRVLDCAASSPKLLEEPFSLTWELLGYLEVQLLDAAGYRSAGIYQLLHF